MITRVVLDALAARFGGAAYATINLVKALAAHQDIEEVVLVCRSGTIVSDRAPSGPGIRTIRLRPASRLELTRRLAWEAVRLPKLLRDQESAVMTWSGMPPLPVRAPVVCYFANPLVFLDDGVGNRLRRAAARRTARHAAHVIAPTAGMADLAAPALGRRPEVVPHGIDHERFTPGPAPGTDVLMVADLYPHKRHDLAIEAWQRLPAPRPRLRLIGDARVAPRHAAWIAGLIRAARDHGEIVMESALTDDQLVAAYHAAAVFVCPSLRESFCLPLLEALACGVPAVVADLASLRETGGQVANFVDSDDPGAWAAAIERALVDGGVRARAATAGPEHAAHYTWDRAAALLADKLLER